MNNLHRLLAVASAAFFITSAQAQNAGTVTNHAFAVGKGAGITGYTSVLCTAAQLAVGQSAADPICKTITGDVTITSAGVTAIGATKVTSADLNADVFSTAHSWGGTQTFTAPVLGTPASGTLTNATGLPISSGVSGLGTGCATFLGTPSSANLRGCLTDEVGTGAAYFVGGALGTPASATLTNATGLPLAGHAAQNAFTFVGNNTSGSASPTAVDIALLTSKASPASTDLVMISDQAASGAWKKVTISSLASAGSVASIAGNTGAFTLSHGITNSTNDLQIDVATQRGYLAGLTLSTAGSSATYGIAIGVAVDSTSADFMKLTSAFTKTTSSWALGTAAGSLDTGTIANSTWYHVYLIKRPDTGVVDVLLSLSATSPTMPTNYTLFRRIGSMKTNGSAQWTAFNQLGDDFVWLASVVDVNSATLTAGTPVLETLSVPTGVQVFAQFNAAINSTSSLGILINSPDQTAVTTPSFPNYSLGNGIANAFGVASLLTRTNTSAQVRVAISATSSGFSITTQGWKDARGKLD